MKVFLIVLFIALATGIPAKIGFKKPSAFDPSLSRKRCPPPPPSETAKAPELAWNQSPEEMEAQARKIYNSEGRLGKRTYLDSKSQNFYAPYDNNPVKIPLQLIKSVTVHIETALAMGYADHVTFADMGHAHMLTPLDFYKSVRHLKTKQILSILYDHPRTKFLYHTAEQLKMMDENNKPINDRYLQQRFYTRNLIAGNTGGSEIHLGQSPPDQPFNTVHNWPGHFSFSGFDISANKNGCFPYYDKNNNLKYFDLSPNGHSFINQNTPQHDEEYYGQ